MRASACIESRQNEYKTTWCLCSSILSGGSTESTRTVGPHYHPLDALRETGPYPAVHALICYDSFPERLQYIVLLSQTTTAFYGPAVSNDHGVDVMRAACDAGCVMFDTAEIYQYFGEQLPGKIRFNEELVGV
mmetsp:Transcript_21814/g.37442  ORF Transcript_21814/g.37442 Transcript_21814/m.37442 type:complete len:133 (-) Transcript_21814:65-463(-)